VTPVTHADCTCGLAVFAASLHREQCIVHDAFVRGEHVEPAPMPAKEDQ
jgi:hypothetical protein